MVQGSCTISAESAQYLRGRSQILSVIFVLWTPDLSQGFKTSDESAKAPNKTKCIIVNLLQCESEWQGREGGTFPGQDLTGTPEVDIRTYCLFIIKLSWKPSESGVIRSVFTPLCAVHESLTNNLD